MLAYTRCDSVHLSIPVDLFGACSPPVPSAPTAKYTAVIGSHLVRVRGRGRVGVRVRVRVRVRVMDRVRVTVKGAIMVLSDQIAPLGDRAPYGSGSDP